MWPRRFAWLHLDFSCRCAAQLLRMECLGAALKGKADAEAAAEQTAAEREDLLRQAAAAASVAEAAAKQAAANGGSQAWSLPLEPCHR